MLAVLMLVVMMLSPTTILAGNDDYQLSDAFNQAKEIEAFKKLGDEVRISPEKPVVLFFDDGSVIEYKIQINSHLSNQDIGVNTYIPNMSWTLTKTYIYGASHLKLSFSAYGKLDTPCVYVDRAETRLNLGVQAELINRNQVIERSVGCRNTNAQIRYSGTYKCYLDPPFQTFITKDYAVTMKIDPALPYDPLLIVHY